MKRIRVAVVRSVLAWAVLGLGLSEGQVLENDVGVEMEPPALNTPPVEETGVIKELVEGGEAGESEVVTFDVEVVFRGLETVTEDEAREMIENQLDALEKRGTSGARADDAAFFLQRALRRRGFNEAQVRWEMEGDVVVLLVEEGVALELGELDVSGNEALEDAGIRELLTKPARERLRLGPGEAVPYVETEIEQGVGEIESFYGLLGYLNAEVTLAETGKVENRVNVALRVDEGDEDRVGEISLPEGPDEDVKVALQKVQADLEGGAYTTAMEAVVARKVEQAGQSAGYMDVGVEVATTERAPEEGKVVVDVAATAEWGSKYVLGGVRVEGNEVIQTRFFERMFREDVGKPYSPQEVTEQVNEILETGAFEAVLLNPVRAGDGSNQMVLELEVQEAPTRSVGVGVGAGTYEGGIFGLDYRDVGLWGLARTFFAELEFTQRGVRGEIGYEDPWFLWSDWSLNTGLFGKTQENEGYSIFETGAKLQLTRKFGKEESQSFSIFAQPSYSDVTEAEIEPEFLGKESYVNAFFGMSYGWDTRDDLSYPTEGSVFETTLGMAPSGVGSDVGYLRSTVRAGHYRQVGLGTLRLNARAGIIAPSGDAEGLPIDLRFFNGGARSVRSFQERELGPRNGDGRYPVGGEFFTVFNVEYDVPVVGELSVVPFFDAGNLLGDAGDAGFTEMHYAGGLGLRLKTPIGPLRIDYGHNLNRGENEPSGSWHIGFGVAF